MNLCSCMVRCAELIDNGSVAVAEHFEREEERARHHLRATTTGPSARSACGETASFCGKDRLDRPRTRSAVRGGTRTTCSRSANSLVLDHQKAPRRRQGPQPTAEQPSEHRSGTALRCGIEPAHDMVAKTRIRGRKRRDRNTRRGLDPRHKPRRNVLFQPVGFENSVSRPAGWPGSGG